MKRITALLAFLILVFLPGVTIHAQDKQPTKEETKTAAPRRDVPQLNIQIVFSEYEGDKKVKSLPYGLVVLPGSLDAFANWSKIRVGERVPVTTNGEGGAVQLQYIDVGTNIDCRAAVADGGHFHLLLNLERSWVQGETTVSTPKDQVTARQQDHEPIIRQFRSETSLTMHDGQTLETNFATDPANGRTIKLEVTLTVMK